MGIQWASLHGDGDMVKQVKLWLVSRGDKFMSELIDLKTYDTYLAEARPSSSDSGQSTEHIKPTAFSLSQWLCSREKLASAALADIRCHRTYNFAGMLLREDSTIPCCALCVHSAAHDIFHVW